VLLKRRDAIRQLTRTNRGAIDGINEYGVPVLLVSTSPARKPGDVAIRFAGQSQADRW
jgi:hypothetical protein